MKLMTLAVLAMFILPLASSEDAAELEKYLDCLTDKKVDIVFVFDTTNSMGGEISELRAVANKFATDLEASSIDYRLGLVEFRDFPETCGEGKKIQCGSPGDFAYQVKGNGTLTSEISTFSSWLKELKAGGGGSPGPEAVLAALRHAVSDITWRTDAGKAIIVLTDAGPHPDGSCCNAEGDTLEGSIFLLTDQGARVFVIGPDDASLIRIAEDTGGQFYKIRSGLSVKPLLEEITQSMSCTFDVVVEATCENKQLEAKVQLVGKETIPYVAEQTEAWMYLDQAGSISRVNLSYDPVKEAYKAKVSDVCGPVDVTVYGRVGERSAVHTVKVECEACESAAVAEVQGLLSISGRVFNDNNGDGIKSDNEAGLEGWNVVLDKPDGSTATAKTDRNGYYIFTGLLPGSYGSAVEAMESWTSTAQAEGIQVVELVDAHESEINFGFKLPLANQAPTINSLIADSESPQDVGSIITWTVNASDPDGDQLLYRFFLNDEPMTEWITENSWTWTPNEVGTYRLEVQLRDGMHSSSNGLDDRKYAVFDINTMEKMPTPVLEKASQEWNRTYGGSNSDRADSILQTNDGGYIILGETASFSTNGGDDSDAWLFKIDADGNMLWDTTFGGPQDDFGTSVLQTNDIGYILSGTKDFTGTPYSGSWLIKTDSNGNIRWEKILGNYGEIFEIDQTTDNGYIALAWGVNCSLFKTDSNGEKIWEKHFEVPAYQQWGSVQQTIDGGYIVVVSINTPREHDAWMFKTDASGDWLWNKTFGGSKMDIPCQVLQSNDGSYIIAGWTFSFGNGSADAWLIKTDVNGNEVWSKTFGGEDYDLVHSIQPTADGGYILAGTTESFGNGNADAWLIKTDLDGNEVWSKTFGGMAYDTANSIQPTADGGYIFAGETKSFGAGEMDAWLVKVDERGNIIQLPSEIS